MNTIITRQASKSSRTIYWIFTGIIFLLDSLMPAFTFNTNLAREGISHLGYPDYFRVELSVFKIIGGILLILPMVARRLKEWAYIGFAFDFISAFIAHVVVDGFGGDAIFPLTMLVFLSISYVYYHKITDEQGAV